MEHLMKLALIAIEYLVIISQRCVRKNYEVSIIQILI